MAKTAAKLLIFDFDGTICDTGPGIAKAVQASLKEIGFAPLSDEKIKSCIGFGLHRLIEELDLEKPLTEEELKHLGQVFRSHYEKLFRENSKPYPGIVEFLKSWPHQLAIASNKEMYYLNELLNGEPWNQFSWLKVMAGDSLPTKKPEPEMIYEIIQASGCSKDQTLMIGDGHPDMQVAVRADIKSIAISFGYSELSDLLKLGAHSSIDSFAELPAAITALFPGSYDPS